MDASLSVAAAAAAADVDTAEADRQTLKRMSFNELRALASETA